MRSKKFVWFLMLGILIALSGCGSDGNRVVDATNGNGVNGNGDDSDDTAPPMLCPDGQVGTYPDCMTSPPSAPAGGHDAVIAGIVNPSKAGDPSTARGTDAANRPGGDDDRTKGSLGDSEPVFDVVAGGSGEKTKTTVRIGTGANADNDLNIDQLDKNDMAGTPMKNLPGQFENQNMDTVLGNFNGSVHEKTVEKVTDTLTVFSNVGDATDERYSDFYSDTNAPNRPGVSSATTTGVLTLDATAAIKELGLFSGPNDRVPTGPNQQYTVPVDDADTTTVQENKFMGAFNGVPGTYECTGGSACTLTTNDDGHLTITGALTFTPTEEDLTKIVLPGVKSDTDYLAFGYWVRTTEDSAGKTTYGVGTVYDGSESFTTVTLEGTATYSGKAAGMYGRKTLNQYGQVVEGRTTSGHFTADANLMVRFGGDDVPASKNNEIEGTISNFMDGDQVISPGWTAELKAIRFDASGNALDGFGESDAEGGKGVTTGNGNWRGAFFGNPVDANGVAITNDPATVDAENAPTGVVGDFTAHFANGHVIGAFGATKDKE